MFDIAVTTGGPPPHRCICPACSRLLSPKPLEVCLQVDRQHKRHETALTLANQMTLPTPGIRGMQPLLIGLLEDVRSLWNVGSIFRSADGAGAELLLLCGITGTPPRKEIAKTSLGAEDSVRWLYCASVTDVSAELKALGYALIGLELTAGLPGVGDSVDLRTVMAATPLRKPVCVLVGNEVNGLSMEALQACDLICSLPMRGVKESLNVAVAFGIASYMIAEQLLQST